LVQHVGIGVEGIVRRPRIIARAIALAGLRRLQMWLRTVSCTLGLFAAMMVSAVAATPAVAIKGCEEPTTQSKCLWTIEGTKLASGHQEESRVHIKSGTKYIMKGKVSGTETEITASGEHGKEDDLLGGDPGTAEGTATFEGVTVVKPKNCMVNKGVVTTKPLKSTISWFYKSDVFQGIDFVITPASGTIFATVKFEGEKCSIKGFEANVEGSAAGGSTTAEATTHTVTFKKPESTWEIYLYGDESPIKPAVTLGGEVATVTGEGELSLISGKKFGID
jgi:hypothetical protein